MTSRHATLPCLAAALLASGCASAPAEDYPSLAIRDVERVTGTLDPPEATAFEPEAPAPDTLDRLDALRTQAADAHAEFLAAAPDIRGTVRAARGTTAGSEAWAQAQVALSDLESIRSRAMIALADLDRIYVDAATSGLELERIADARGNVVAMVEDENRLIAELLTTLR